MSWHGYASGGMPDYYPPALAGVWAKVRRAETHRQALIAAIEKYVTFPPFIVTETTDRDVTTVRADATILPPNELGLILGDMVQNLRSALDHMAYQFARTVKPKPRDTQFPIFDNPPEDFATAPGVSLIPQEVRDIMEAMQPYQEEGSIGHMIGSQLASLRRLSNRDKHRVLLIAERIVVAKHVFHNTPQGRESGVGFEFDPDGQWATVTHPSDPTFGPYTVAFEAEVTMIEPGLPWRSGLEGIAHALFTETTLAIGAFRGQWPLLTAAQPA